MIDRKALLGDLQDLARRLEDDLRDRAAKDAETDTRLRAEWASAKQDSRTGEAYETWLEDRVTQAAVAWILACVFVRFLEDNELLDRPYLSGPGPRRQLAMDHETAYFTGERAGHSERDYLLAVFRDVGRLPAMGPLLDARHNPLWALQLSADGARELVAFWRKINPGTGALVHDFADPSWTTRWLGDLYQDLSEYARKRYALLQTPDFVVSFILDRTLEPAIQEFGYREVRLIDPTCGSGHFLLDAFHRLVERWRRDEPGTNPRELAQRALNQVFGVDLSPTVIAIARFRLIVEALRTAGVRRLDQAPDFRTRLAVGDSLLHGPRPKDEGAYTTYFDFARNPFGHLYATEDAEELRDVLSRRFHVVFGNPPYITPKDPAARERYRQRFASCSGKYSLGVPFTERFLDLALPEEEGRPAGFVGMITANSFMKREFGKVLIERTLPQFDLTHVIDMSGAYVPGHGTPTVILFVRNRRPVANAIRAVRGIRGEPGTPDDPARGLVWTAIVNQVDRPGSQSDFVSSDDVERAALGRYPWNIGGGGAAELKDRLDEVAVRPLGELVDAIGFAAITGEDDAFVAESHVWRRQRVPDRLFAEGTAVRDWVVRSPLSVAFPYDVRDHALAVREPGQVPRWTRVAWPLRTTLRRRLMFGTTQDEAGLVWYEFRHKIEDRVLAPLTIVFAFVATHNHYVLERSGTVFKQSAPVIKLPADAKEDDHLGLLGLLNSSTACFWLKQVCHNKGSTVDQHGARQRTDAYEDFFEFTGTKLLSFPITATLPTGAARELDASASRMLAVAPRELCRIAVPTGSVLLAARTAAESEFLRQVARQEDLDWECYHRFELVDATLTLPSERTPGIQLGERAFEIVMARKMAAGELESRWFERHGSTPITEIPSHWPEDYREIVRRRIAVIESDPDIALIERPEYKRRWNIESWEEQEHRALREWLLDRLEDARYWPDPQIATCARLADLLRHDAAFRQVAEVYKGRADFDVTDLVVELVGEEAVPFLSDFRYSESGTRKRVIWKRTWDLQRREDAGEKVEIDVPPKYTSGDFARATYWRLRGKLDVPKERFILYPLAGTDSDPTPVIGWAGWDHLQQAKALAGWIVERQTQDAWTGDRLRPLLAGLLELVPWLRQWHNDVDSDTGQRLGDYFAHWVEEEARKIGATLDELRSWTPPAKVRRARKKKGDA